MDDQTALYRFYDPDEKLLYVGITRNPPSRFRDHESQKIWWRQIARIDVEWHPNRQDALDAEREAIRTEKPLHNIIHAVGPGNARDITLIWTCEACGEPIRDRTGYLAVRHAELGHLERRARENRGPLHEIDLTETIANPNLGHWHAHHCACDPGPRRRPLHDPDRTDPHPRPTPRVDRAPPPQTLDSAHQLGRDHRARRPPDRQHHPMTITRSARTIARIVQRTCQRTFSRFRRSGQQPPPQNPTQRTTQRSQRTYSTFPQVRPTTIPTTANGPGTRPTTPPPLRGGRVAGS